MKSLERPVLAVDVVLIGFDGTHLLLLLCKRRQPPFRGSLALPGVAVHVDETLEQAALRSLVEKGGLSPELLTTLHLEQVATFDSLFRDPRGRTVSVAHMGLTAAPIATDAGSWIRLGDIKEGTLPFDHGSIVAATMKRLAGKLRYTNIAGRLLPDQFRMNELQAVYEAILGRRLNRANFRTKLLKINLLVRVGEQIDAVGSQGGRPPHLYRFAGDEVEAEDRDFV